MRVPSGRQLCNTLVRILKTTRALSTTYILQSTTPPSTSYAQYIILNIIQSTSSQLVYIMHIILARVLPLGTNSQYSRVASATMHTMCILSTKYSSTVCILARVCVLNTACITMHNSYFQQYVHTAYYYPAGGRLLNSDQLNYYCMDTQNMHTTTSSQ